MMKKIIHIVMIAVLFAAGAAMISCNKQTACERAKDRCDECYDGDELSNCLSSVDVCKILLPGPPRDDCCDSLYDSLANCQ
jgi:hypothetical protein